MRQARAVIPLVVGLSALLGSRTGSPLAADPPALPPPPARSVEGRWSWSATATASRKGPVGADARVLRFTAGHTIFEVDADDEVTPFRQPSREANGLALDPQGRLLAAEAQARRVTRTEADGTVTPIADRFEGHRLNQPNDIVVRSDGTVYFTDPTFGDPAVAAAELDFRGVFRISPTGELTAERRGSVEEAPNGVALSPDERRLYVSDYTGDRVWLFDVAADGSLSEARPFLQAARPDGLAVDLDGNLFVAADDGVAVFARDGKPGASSPCQRFPPSAPSAARGRRTLYITPRDSLYRRMTRPACPTPQDVGRPGPSGGLMTATPSTLILTRDPWMTEHRMDVCRATGRDPCPDARPRRAPRRPTRRGVARAALPPLRSSTDAAGPGAGRFSRGVAPP